MVSVMMGLIVFVACLAAALGAGALASWSDFRSMTIPNRYPAVIAVSFLGALAAAHWSGAEFFTAPLRHIGTSAVVFAVTFIMFFMNMFGGGDSKLLTAFALWTGLAGLLPMLMTMALTGGLVGLAALAIGRWRPFKAPREGGWIAQVQTGHKRVPYGIPITVGAVASFLQMGYLSPEKLAAFVGGGGS